MVEVVGAQLVDDAREKVLQVETRHAHQWATNASMHVIHVSLRPEPSGTLSTNGEDFELATSELSESNASKTVTTSSSKQADALVDLNLQIFVLCKSRNDISVGCDRRLHLPRVLEVNHCAVFPEHIHLWVVSARAVLSLRR